jgi:hypothetical protein
MAKPRGKLFGQNTNPAYAYGHTVADAAAVQAVSQGRATPDQQIRAYAWIIERAAMTYDETFHPESDRMSSFMQGRRFVGLKLVLMSKINIQRLKSKEDPTTPPSENGD